MNEKDGSLAFRPVDVMRDRAGLLSLDTTFHSKRIYTVQRSEAAFVLVEATASPPVVKAFALDEELGDDRLWEHGFVAEEAGRIVGFVAVRLEPWNRRLAIWHLYVAPDRRGRRIGRRLLEMAEGYARTHDARWLWLETSNVNVPAIQFYRRSGFEFCGLDTTLYDPASEAAGETALFFARDIR